MICSLEEESTSACWALQEGLKEKVALRLDLKHKHVLKINFVNFFSFLFFPFLGPPPRHMDVPRLVV